MLPVPDDASDSSATLDRAAQPDSSENPVFDRLAQLAAKLLGAPIALISLIDDKHQWIKARVGVDVVQIPRDHSICTHAVDLGDLLVIADAAQDPRSRDSLLVAGAPHARFYAGVPLWTAEGLAIGTLCVLDERPRAGLSPEEADTLRDLGLFAVALLEARCAQGSRATGGRPNLLDFMDEINGLIADAGDGDGQVAVLVIDAATPNQCEEIARTLGQAAADLFVDVSAQSIGECLPEGSRLYDLSAARFGCILKADATPRFEEILDRLAFRLRRPGPAGPFIPVATSVGLGVAYHPDHGANAAALLQAAASGAHESLEGGTPWCAYSPALDRAARRAAHLLRDIGPALAGTDQLRLVYQPKLELATGRGIGAEVLIRWKHPIFGPIPPDEFVPLVERTTLVNAMTDWTLGTALRQIALWRADGLDPQISINVSMQDLWDDHFATRLSGLLERCGVEPGWIDIEVTESALMKDPVRVGHQLDAVRRLGVAIEIDDYGTGQSGLSYLKYIPASYVKIAQVFVSRLAHDTKDQIIVRSTINLAHDLGLKVVAEGIDNEAALDWLRAHGCDIGQGNLLSPALEAADFERSLRMSARSPHP